MIEMPEAEIGGAVVRRRINRGGMEPWLAGQRLSREQLLAMPSANRRALVNTQHIVLFPVGGAAPSAGGTHLVQLGRGQYDVIQGAKLNDKPLSKDEAEELATRP